MYKGTAWYCVTWNYSVSWTTMVELLNEEGSEDEE